MFDNTPLGVEEIIDQCRALAYATVELSRLRRQTFWHLSCQNDWIAYITPFTIR
ncbi:hypothetical protein [Candidatus Symbiopectobacterium sp. NZEC151]|uniref:hypothetical protein n=1 Tax=Candidatus Symbiopectobacterium sp. NZEC151 TaxID=2820470 RepID=UPI0029CABE82|nr:hypothetical protein [Candidatus Symbiopectobacterium sp. NZEC151]